jgi:hypothetical protein
MTSLGMIHPKKVVRIGHYELRSRLNTSRFISKDSLINDFIYISTELSSLLESGRRIGCAILSKPKGRLPMSDST